MLRVLVTFIFGFLLATFVSLLSLPASADSLSGLISSNGTNLVFIPDSNRVPFVVQTMSMAAASTLTRLSDGDLIIANGSLDTQRGVALIESVDFVGLKQIIGRWYTRDSKGIMRFNTYQDVDVISLVLASGSATVVAQKSLKYTVSPSNGGDWIMFLSDERSTQMGSFYIKDNVATLKLFNTQTGDVSQVIRLQKVGN